MRTILLLLVLVLVLEFPSPTEDKDDDEVSDGARTVPVRSPGRDGRAAPSAPRSSGATKGADSVLHS